jgi:hypothetical protein
MALQHHFVVVVEDGKAWIDWNMYTNHDEQSTFDDVKGEWLYYDDLTKAQVADYLRSAELASQMVEPFEPELPTETE